MMYRNLHTITSSKTCVAFVINSGLFPGFDCCMYALYNILTKIIVHCSIDVRSVKETSSTPANKAARKRTPEVR
jgi:hypothetical protein